MCWKHQIRGKCPPMGKIFSSNHPTVRLMGIAKRVTLAGSTPEYYVTLCNQFGCLDPLICLNSKIMMFIYLLYLLNWSKRSNHSFFGNFDIAWWSSKTAVPYGMLVQPSSSCEATAKVTPHRVNDRRAATWLPPTVPLSASSYFIVDFCSLQVAPLLTQIWMGERFILLVLSRYVFDVVSFT
jgi:hypothetical protein